MADPALNKRFDAHLSYAPDLAEESLRIRLYDLLVSLVDLAAAEDGKAPQEFKVLDVGSGRGEIMMRLANKRYPVEGIDLDPICVELSSRYGPCRTCSTDQIREKFADEQFDLIISSHVLEHVPNPLEVVESFKYVTRKWLLLAVPNPIQPLAMYKNVVRQSWCNITHIALWDHSHFENFLKRHAGLKIVRPASDFVRIIWGWPRALLHKIGILKPITWLEIYVLPKLLPRYSDSVIVLCAKPAIAERSE